MKIWVCTGCKEPCYMLIPKGGKAPLLCPLMKFDFVTWVCLNIGEAKKE